MEAVTRRDHETAATRAVGVGSLERIANRDRVDSVSSCCKGRRKVGDCVLDFDADAGSAIVALVRRSSAA